MPNKFEILNIKNLVLEEMEDLIDSLSFTEMKMCNSYRLLPIKICQQGTKSDDQSLDNSVIRPINVIQIAMINPDDSIALNVITKIFKNKGLELQPFIISQEDYKRVLFKLCSHKKLYISPFGNKLIQAGYIGKDQLKQALIEVRNSKQSLVKVLESMTQKALSPELLRQYKKYHLFELKILYGVDSLNPDTEDIAYEQMTELINSLVNINICRRHKLLPLRTESPSLFSLFIKSPTLLIAMVDPDNLQALDDLKKLLKFKGLEMQRTVITEEDYNNLLQRYYQEDREREKQEAAIQAKLQAEKLADVGTVEEMDIDLDEAEDGADGDLASEDVANEAPIIKLVNKVLIKAIEEGTSDIHIEPQEDKLRIRFRQDGVLKEVFNLPKYITTAVTNRFKIIAELDIIQRRLPQNGKIRRVFQGKNVNFFINTIPSRYGEKICLRILNNSAIKFRLDSLIKDSEILEKMRTITCHKKGVIICTGKKLCGKTTTAYSLLAELNQSEYNIYTIEDDIYHRLPGITQLKTNPEQISETINILNNLSNQDVDIVYINTTLTPEIINLVFSQLANQALIVLEMRETDTIDVILLLYQWGINPYHIYRELLCVISQNLLRKVCSECKEAYQPTKEDLTRFSLSITDENITFYRAKTLTGETLQRAVDRLTLCQKCQGIGYKGRVGVYEILPVFSSPIVRNLISQETPVNIIKQVALENGMTSFYHYGLNLVKQGHTTLEEIESCFGRDLMELHPQIHLNNKSLTNQIQKIKNDVSELFVLLEKLINDI